MNKELTKKAQRFLSVLPHCQVLGFEVPEVSDDCLIMTMPYQAKAVGNPFNNALHGGCLTTLMDTACGTAAYTFLPGSELCPTLDLRIDHFSAADAHAKLFADAKVSHTASSVMFTGCQVFQHPDGHPERKLIASCTATFMRLQPGVVRGPTIDQTVAAMQNQSLNKETGLND